ncbi:unnamed protein product [Mesocestoides corti]|uniref:Uncharacterized protein n=1 Tax=Mesocestoides corti TaxID=53468 RepID=A0A3P6GTS3_MESCO|nr:unnamed protein product [Mesocestoides corti]
MRDRQRKLSHVPVLGAILSSPSANQHNPSYAAGDRKRSLDSLFAPTKPCSYGGAVLLTGNACCPPNEKSFSDGGFPLLLVSAPTSASAAEFAAATAVASGAPASSLIPVPVQIVPDSASASSTCPPVETSVTLVSKTTNDCDQRLVFPLLPGADGKMNGCALGFPVLVSSRPRQTNSPH